MNVMEWRKVTGANAIEMKLKKNESKSMKIVDIVESLAFKVGARDE